MACATAMAIRQASMLGYSSPKRKVSELLLTAQRRKGQREENSAPHGSLPPARGCAVRKREQSALISGIPPVTPRAPSRNSMVGSRTRKDGAEAAGPSEGGGATQVGQLQANGQNVARMS